MKNLAASVRARLLNLARAEGRDFNRMLTLYLQECLLARLTISPYKDRFVLKGGVLLYLRYGEQARPTVDLDLLGRSLAPDLDHIAEIVSEIAQIDVSDGVTFDPSSVHSARIREEAVYEGVRVKLVGYLDTARVPLQIDIGFGDALVPHPKPIRYSTLLGGDDAKPANLLAYAIETVVAEKFQAMVALGSLNSRAKDFYDLYVISQHEPLKASTLQAALSETFARRGTLLEDTAPVFTPVFAETQTLVKAWAGLRRANPTLFAPTEFAAVMVRLRAFLHPVVAGEALGTWQPERAIWDGGEP